MIRKKKKKVKDKIYPFPNNNIIISFQSYSQIAHTIKVGIK